MKKINFVLVLTLAAMLGLIVGCEQESLQDPLEGSSQLSKKEDKVLPRSLDDFKKHTLEREDLVELGASSTEERVMNELMLAYAEQLMNSLKAENIYEVDRGNDIRAIISNFAEENNNDFIPLRELASRYQLNELSPQVIRNLPSGRGITEPIEYQDVKYEFIVNVPNIKNADFTLDPIITPGLRTGEDDAVFAWYLNEDNTTEQVAITEEQAMEMKNPLLVVSPHPIEGEPGYVLSYTEELEDSKKDFSGLEKNRMAGKLEIDQYQVKNPYYYENNGGLEYRVVLYTSQVGSSNYLLDESYEAKYFGITRNDVTNSVNFTNNRDMGFYSNTANFLVNRDYYLLTYERDWAREKKNVDCNCSCYNTSSYRLSPKMRYSNDFWNRRCGRGDLAWPNVGSSLVDNNSKGSITIERTQ